MPSNHELQEYLEWENNKNSFFSQVKKELSIIQIIALGGVMYLVWYMLKNGQKYQTWGVILGAIVLIVILLKPKKKVQNEPIPDHIIKIIAQKLMNNKIGVENEYPQGTIVKVMDYCKLRFQGEWGLDYKPFVWEVGATVTYPDKLKKEVLISLNPYFGYITGIREMRTGYNGNTSPDLKVLMPSVMKMDNQNQQQVK